MRLKNIQKYIRTHEARGTAGTAALMIVRKLGNSAIALILAPLLGAEGYGVYVFAIACISIASMVVLVGLDRLMVREVAQCYANQKFETLRGLVQSAIGGVLFSSLTVVLLGYVALSFFGNEMGAQKSEALGASLVVLPFFAFTLLAQSLLMGLNRIVWGQVPINVVRPSVFIVLCLSSVSLGVLILDGVGALVLFATATVVAFAFAFVGAIRALPKKVWRVHARYQFGYWLNSGLSLMVIAVLQSIQLQGTAILVGLLQDAATTGIYALTFAVAQLVIFIHTAADRPLGPAVASLIARNEKQELQRTLRRLARLSFASALPVTIVLVVFGDPILGLLGEEFRVGYVALVIMVLGNIVHVATGQPGILLMMAGHEKDLTKASLLRLGMLIGLNVILVPLFGLVGAAISVSLSIIVPKLLLMHYALLRVGLKTSIFAPKIVLP